MLLTIFLKRTLSFHTKEFPTHYISAYYCIEKSSVIHDTGAHGYAMGYNYNGKLKSAELLLKENGEVEMIRRAETPKDYFSTFDCFDIFKM